MYTGMYSIFFNMVRQLKSHIYHLCHINLYTSSDVVAVQTVRWDSPIGEILLKSKADGCLSRSTETSEPDTAASESTTLTDRLSTLISSHLTSLEHYIGCFYF